MGIMARMQSKRMIEMRDNDLEFMAMASSVDDESLLAEMDKNIGSVMRVIDMESNVLLSEDFRGL